MNTREQDLFEEITESILSSIQGGVLYENSVQKDNNKLYFMIRLNHQPMLVVADSGSESEISGFEGQPVEWSDGTALLCKLTRPNAEAIRERFSFTRPVLIGKTNSYGFGDRLGNAGAAHLKAVRETGFKPILAQQSIRELERTKRTAEEVLDAASWAVFREGYTEGFGADGDHLKTTDDIDLMMKAGYTMFTIDPSDFVVDDAISMNDDDLQQAYKTLPWELLKDQPETLLNRLTEQPISLENGFQVKTTHREIMAGMVKYGNVITHTKKLADYINEAWADKPAELELSVDETSRPTTLFEHYLIASQLNRLGVELVSLAPRFCGDFEKGIDFKGDLNQFRKEYIQHLAIAKKFGGYKLSIHSGSDKFSVYEVIGSLNEGTVHVKTAGTSYLEALRTIAEADPEFFREILKFSLGRFETDKKTYHISATVDKVPDPDSLDKTALLHLLDDDDARQVLHVTYGSVLSGEVKEAEHFKNRLMEVLRQNEALHEENLEHHFDKHLNPFL
jgi:tagaturonate epimerase